MFELLALIGTIVLLGLLARIVRASIRVLGGIALAASTLLGRIVGFVIRWSLRLLAVSVLLLGIPATWLVVGFGALWIIARWPRR